MYTNDSYIIRDFCATEERDFQTIPYLNKMIQEGHAADLILVGEALQERQLARIADEIAARKEVRIVLIAGPSSSGKTSTSKRLCVQLMACHRHPVALSTDNWFVNRCDSPLDEEGNPDLESLYTMDVKLFCHDLNALIAGEEIALPYYNFKTGWREYRGERLKLDSDMLLVVEGIHALNPLLTTEVAATHKFKLFAAPMTPISLDGNRWIPTTVNRLLRRISRDFQTRGKSAEQTISDWPKVRAGEEKWIIPYMSEADAVFDTSMFYELSALKVKATEVLQEVPHDSPVIDTVNRLLDFLNYFTPIDATQIPRTSLLREFIGGSLFDVG